MARRLPTLVVPHVAGIPGSDIPPPEWLAAKSAIARVDPGTPSAPSEFAANIAGQTVWVKLDRISPTMGAYGADPTGVADSTQAFNTAAADAFATGAVLHIDPGEYLVDNDIIIPAGGVVETRGSEHVVITRTASGGAQSSGTIDSRGTIGTPHLLSADASEGATAVTVATDPGLAPGDLVHLTSDRAPWGGSARPDQDIQVVDRVTGSGPYTVHFRSTLTRDFAVAHASRLRKITPANTKIHGITFRYGPGVVNTNGVDLWYGGTDAEIGDIGVDGWMQRGVHMFACYGSTVDRVVLRDPIDITSGRGYGVLLREGSKRCEIAHVEGHNCRHAVDINNGCSFNLVRDSVGYKDQATANVDVDFGCHGVDARYNTFLRCETHGQSTGFACGNATYGGDTGTTYESCKAFGSGAGIGAHFYAKVNSPETRMINCESRNGEQGMRIDGNEGTIIAPYIDGTTRSGIIFNNSLDSQVIGGVVKNVANIGLNSAGTSDYLVARDTKLINCAVPTQLVGANNTINVITR